MKPATVLLLALLAAAVLAGTRLGFGRRRIPPALRPLTDTGVGFVFLGALLGAQGANLVTAGILAQLSPVLVIGLGWIGFLYGSHFEWRLIRRFPGGLYAAGLLQALVTFALVSGGAWWLLSAWLAQGVPWQERAAATLILGICASGTAPAGVFTLASRRRISADNLNALRFLSAVDDLPGVALLGMMGALLHPDNGAGGPWLPGLWLALSTGIGVALGYVTHWLFPTGEDVRINSLVLLGIVSLGAGAAAMLSLSPLYVTTLAGMAFANLSPRKESAYGLLAQREHTLYAVFLVVGGLLFRFDGTPLYWMVPAYLLLRAAGKVAGGWLSRAAFLGPAVSPWIGAGMLFQGGMALAMVLSFQRTHLAALDSQVTTTIVLGVVASGLLGPPVVGRVLSLKEGR
jgi:hypothetical protein